MGLGEGRWAERKVSAGIRRVLQVGEGGTLSHTPDQSQGWLGSPDSGRDARLSVLGT